MRNGVIVCSCVVIALLLGSATIARAQDVITNARVTEMVKMGLDDEVVIARIKSGTCSFALTDSDLIELKKGGVSPKVVAAMLEASAITVARVAVDGKNLELHTLAQAKVGGRLGNLMTGGLKSVKWKAYLQGARASVAGTPTSVLTVELPKGQSVEDLVLVELDRKDDRRELEVASGGGTVGAKSGIKAEAIIKTTASPAGANKFTLSAPRLKPGEYLLFVVGSADNTKGLYGKGYDFSVQ